MTILASTVQEVGFIRGRGLVLLSGVLMSMGGPLIRLLDSASEWQFLAYRAAALVAVLSMVLALRYPGRFLATLQAAGWTGVLAGRFLSCAFVGFVFSITHTTVAKTLFLLSAAPFAAALLGLAGPGGEGEPRHLVGHVGRMRRCRRDDRRRPGRG